VRIILGGDLFIGQCNDLSKLIDRSVFTLFQDADVSIVNMESPIVNSPDDVEIKKTGPNLKSELFALELLGKLGVSVVSLANNHIMDYSESSLLYTMSSLSNRGIRYVGAGKNACEASEPLIIRDNEITIGIINACESEWSIATETNSGANPLDVVDICRMIKSLKEQVDFVIVIIHGGHELYKYPSPRMVKLYRFFVDQGADAIIGHHTHCIGGYEFYEGSPIVYSLGNFLFLKENSSESWNTGLLCTLDFHKNMPVSMKLTPVKHMLPKKRLHVCESRERATIMNEVDEISNTISSHDKLLEEWNRFIESQTKRLRILSPLQGVKNSILRGGLFRLGLDRLVKNDYNLRSILNNIRCEAHRDILIEVLVRALSK
jgi:poly-gamma-glutamate synthesis protein (capsule biosynthesis protein)